MKWDYYKLTISIVITLVDPVYVVVGAFWLNNLCNGPFALAASTIFIVDVMISPSCEDCNVSWGNSPLTSLFGDGTKINGNSLVTYKKKKY